MEEKSNTSSLGLHYILEFYGAKNLDMVKYVEDVMLEAARIGKANIITYNFHQFQPYGVSGIVVISESHLSIHTWPEHDYAAIDIFTCSREMDVNASIKYLVEAFSPLDVESKVFERGIL